MSDFKSFVRWVMRDARFHKLYPATVQFQNQDGSVEVLPDDEEIRGTGLRAVPRPGLPGTDINVAAGARCLVGFAEGDPGKPFIAEWEGNGLASVRLGHGTRPVARMGDTVKIATTPSQNVAGIIQGILTIPGPPPVPTPIPPSPFSGVVTLPPTPPVQALIMAGNTKVLA